MVRIGSAWKRDGERVRGLRNTSANWFVDRKSISDLSSGTTHPANLMRSWFSRFLAAVLCAVCLIPAPTSAYYYRGHYYRYRYHGHYYRYYNRGHYYQYYYQGRYYGQRVWVVGSNGRPGYYRYW
jgi:hypothetical protein